MTLIGLTLLALSVAAGFGAARDVWHRRWRRALGELAGFFLAYYASVWFVVRG